MKIYKKSTRNGSDAYTCYEGISDAAIVSSMADLGHTNIVASTEQEFVDSQPEV